MADEENPIGEVREELTEHETADEKREREAREVAERETAARESEHEKRGEDLRAIDSKVTKLCEDVEAWKTQTFSAIEKMGEALTQSTREALEAVRETPQPVLPQNPPAPQPEPVEPQNPPAPSAEDGHPAAKTAQKPSAKKLRFL